MGFVEGLVGGVDDDDYLLFYARCVFYDGSYGILMITHI